MESIPCFFCVFHDKLGTDSRRLHGRDHASSTKEKGQFGVLRLKSSVNGSWFSAFCHGCGSSDRFVLYFANYWYFYHKLLASLTFVGVLMFLSLKWKFSILSRRHAKIIKTLNASETYDSPKFKKKTGFPIFTFKCNERSLIRATQNISAVTLDTSCTI